MVVAYFYQLELMPWGYQAGGVTQNGSRKLIFCLVSGLQISCVAVCPWETKSNNQLESR